MALNTSRPRHKSRQEDSPTNNPARTYLSFLTGPQHHSQQTPFCCFFLELLQLVLGGHDALMVTRAQAPGLARGGPKGICAKERRLNGVEGGEIDVTTSAVWTQAAPHRPGRQPTCQGQAKPLQSQGLSSTTVRMRMMRKRTTTRRTKRRRAVLSPHPSLRRWQWRRRPPPANIAFVAIPFAQSARSARAAYDLVFSDCT